MMKIVFIPTGIETACKIRCIEIKKSSKADALLMNKGKKDESSSFLPLLFGDIYLFSQARKGKILEAQKINNLIQQIIKPKKISTLLGVKSKFIF